MLTRSEKNKEITKQIKKEEIEKHTKKIKTILIRVLIIITIIFTLLFLYMRFIATTGIIVREYGISYENLPSEMNGLKIVHISDLYYGYDVDKDKINELVKLVNKAKPDIIAFTGDLVNNKYKINEKEEEEIIEALNNMNAKIGKYFVRGENDQETSNYIINNTNFKTIDNNSELIYDNGLNPILLIGIDNKYDIEKSFQYYNNEGANKNIFSIVLVHKPDIVEKTLQYEPNLVLAGHSLNGSIKLPKIGGLIRPSGAKEYYDEEYKINNTKLYISGGIGTNNFRLRLFNRPSFNFYRITLK